MFQDPVYRLGIKFPLPKLACFHHFFLQATALISKDIPLPILFSKKFDEAGAG